MSNPPEPPHHEPVPSESPTSQMPVGDRGQAAQEQRTAPIEQRTTPIPSGPGPVPSAAGPVPSAPGPFPGPPPGPPGPPPAGPPPGWQDVTEPIDTEQHHAGFFRDPLALVLAAVTVVALTVAGLIGVELVARHIADAKVADATECVIHDGAKASFGIAPPFLWQHITGHYTNISIRTAGNQIKEAKEMKADLHISDVRLHSTATSGGTIGALDATITWPTPGIKETIGSTIPLFGGLITDVSTNAGDGTVSLKGPFGLAGVTVKPQVVDGKLSLAVESLTGLGGMTFPREAVQPALDAFISTLTSKYPLGIHADSVQVTDAGVVARFSTRNASIPAHSQDPCFAHL
ncbi:MAG TPA: DUF2993 domain-containing protein [Mycobacterium sp.]|nr:DUF2993 domain-containing protein [Mycobacterium sp.]